MNITRAVLPVLALGAIAAPPGRGADLVAVRTEVASTKGTSIRLLQIMDTTKASEGGLRAVQLLSLGSDLRFLQIISVSASERRYSYKLIGPKVSQVVSFEKSPEMTNLTRAEMEKGTGILKAAGTELALNRRDASAQTVRARVERTLLGVYRPEELTALRTAVEAIGACNLRIARGYLLPIVAPDAYRRDGSPCAAAFRDVPEAERDPKWELAFVTMEPSVREYLSWKAGIATGLSR